MKLKIKVKPNSARDEIIQGNPLIVKVKAPAEDNKANMAIIKLLSRHFNLSARIVSGKSSKNKIIEIN